MSPFLTPTVATCVVEYECNETIRTLIMFPSFAITTKLIPNTVFIYMIIKNLWSILLSSFQIFLDWRETDNGN